MFKVQKTCCNQCLFTKDKIVSDERRNQIIRDAVADDSYFNCHKIQLPVNEGKFKDGLCCKGFFNGFKTQAIRIAERLGVVEYVTVTSEGLQKDG